MDGLQGVDDEDNDAPVNEFAEVISDEVDPEFNQKDSILFVIDARKAMCHPAADGGPSFFSQALQCVAACMRDRILNGEHDLVGVLLFGTMKHKVPEGQQGFPHIYLVQPLEEPSANSMRELSLICQAEDGDGSAGPATAVADDFGHMDNTDPLDFANVLWVSSMMFNSTASKNMRRRLYIMTNDDNPCTGNAAMRARALTRSRDLQDARVWIEPFFFAPPPPAAFDLSEGSFWRELVSTVRQNYKGPPPREANEGDGAAETSAGGLPEDQTASWISSCVATADTDVLERVRRTAHRKRVTWSSELTIRDGYAISFLMVSVIRSTPKPSSVKLEARSNEELKTQTVTLCNTHGVVIQKGDLYKGYNFGGKWVYFDHGELTQFGKEGFKPGLTLLGFKNADRLKLHHNLGPSKFIEPSEKVPGSTVAMKALVQSMHEKGKIGVARELKGKVGQPRLVALVPQLRKLDPRTGATQLPCGLHVITLPFSDDLRAVKVPPPLGMDEFTPAQLDAARSLALALELPSNKSPIVDGVPVVSNPASRKHFAYLQMLALNVPGASAEATVDETLPDRAWLAERQPEVAAFQEAFNLPDVASMEASANKRQKTAGAPKIEKSAPPATLAEWRAVHERGALDSLTAPLLKGFCRDHDLGLGGRKADLMARVHDFLEDTKDHEAAAADGVGPSTS